MMTKTDPKAIVTQTDPPDLPMNMNADAIRAVAEVRGAIMVAQNFPRDEEKAFTQIMKACKRPKLAEQSAYAYTRRGTMVEGASIRMAETLARYWGNLQYGIRETNASDDETTFESFCWDVQNNVRVSRCCSQKHVRFSKKKGLTKLTDPRDIYEAVANVGARRLRACILECIPSDIVDSAMDQCNETLKGGRGPVEDQVRKIIVAFDEFGVTQEMIEKRLQHPIKAVVQAEINALQKIFVSLRDGVAKVGDWFNFSDPKKNPEATNTDKLNEKFKDKNSGTDMTNPAINMAKEVFKGVEVPPEAMPQDSVSTQPTKQSHLPDFENFKNDGMLGGEKGVLVNEAPENTGQSTSH